MMFTVISTFIVLRSEYIYLQPTSPMTVSERDLPKISTTFVRE